MTDPFPPGSKREEQSLEQIGAELRKGAAFARLYFEGLKAERLHRQSGIPMCAGHAARALAPNLRYTGGAVKYEWEVEVKPLVEHIVRFCGAVALVMHYNRPSNEASSTMANRLWGETRDR